MRKISTAVVLAGVLAAGVVWNSDALYPGDAQTRLLPWSAPLLRFWASYRNESRKQVAIQQMMRAGPPYQDEAWRLLLQENPADSNWDLDKAPSTPPLVATALHSLDPDRPDSQLAAVYLRRRSADLCAQVVAYAQQEKDNRRRLLVLSMVADWCDFRTGDVNFYDRSSVPAATQAQVKALFRDTCASAGSLRAVASSTPSFPEDRPSLEALARGSDRGKAERAAMQLWFLSSPSNVAPIDATDVTCDERPRLRKQIQRALTTPMTALCSYQLGSLELLGLAKVAPDSRLARGCRAFAAIRGGTYFGDYLYWSGSGETPPKRIPGTSEAWRQWLSVYPDHPGADDASYWLGRCLEKEGQRYEAFTHFLTTWRQLPGDRDMEGRWHDHVMWLLDVGVTAQDLERFLGEHQRDPLRAWVAYALALRRAREHRYAEALQLSEGLALTAAGAPPDLYWEDDWSLAHPDQSPSRTFRLPSSLEEDLAYQRSLWQRCVQLLGQASPQELYRLASFWSENGGWRIGYFLPLRGQRSFLWCYSWDAYAEDSRPGFRPDADVLRDQGRQANQNEIILALMQRILAQTHDPVLQERARYTRFAALEAQLSSNAEVESTFLRRDFDAEARDEARLLLRDFPDTSTADDVFLTLSETHPRPDLGHFMQTHFPDGDRGPGYAH